MDLMSLVTASVNLLGTETWDCAMALMSALMLLGRELVLMKETLLVCEMVAVLVEKKVMLSALQLESRLWGRE